ncbi:MAG: DUF6134 family protein [Gammaproteobacteria bacterium]|jgi:hypothetical protein
MKKLLLLFLLVNSTYLPGSLAMQAKRYDFKVFLGDKEIGHHKFMVTPHNNQTYVSSEASFDVRFLFFTAYSYLHQNNEVWKGDCLQAINATTDDNGEQLFVRGKYNDHGMQLHTHDGSQNLSGCVRTFAYWDPALLNSKKLLNVQTGKLEEVNIQSLGESVIVKDGNDVRARQYRITNPKFSIDLWYSRDQEWLALESTTESGARLRYMVQ